MPDIIPDSIEQPQQETHERPGGESHGDAMGERLRATETEFHRLAEVTAAAILINQGAQVRYVNFAAEGVTGYTRTELLAMNFWDLVHPEFQAFAREWETVRQRGEAAALQYEIKILTKDNEERWLDVTFGVIGFEGKPAELVTAFDITERVRMAAALRKSDETAQALLNAPTDTAILINLEGVILAINQVGAQRLGKSVEELTGVCVYELLPPELARARKARADEVICSGVPLRFEDERAGIIFDNHVFPVFDVQGKVVRLAIFAHDMTEHKRTELALRKSEAKNLALLEAIPDMIFRVRDDGTFLEFVPAKGLEPLLPPGEFLDKKVSEVMPKETARQIMHHIRRILESGVSQEFEYSLSEKGELHHYEARLVLSGVQAREVLAIVRDITQRKAREAAVEEERARIARDLYDGLAHSLLALGLQLDYRRTQVTYEPENVAGGVHAPKEMAQTDTPLQIEQIKAVQTTPLTQLELEILRLVAQRLSNSDIGHQLGLAEKTIGNRLTTVFDKLHVDNRTQAAIYALRQGWASLDEPDE
jgi:PAS domain S-box-containing protein